MGLGDGVYGKDTRWFDDPVTGLSLVSSPPSGHNDTYTGYVPTLTGQQLYTLRVIAIGSASASIVSGVVVGWWFVRMKRSFRHQYVLP